MTRTSDAGSGIVPNLRGRARSPRVIHLERGDLFTLPVQARVNPVNTVGVMGAGLAAQFAARYPGLLEDYKSACASGALRAGTVHTFTLSHFPPRHIINVPTKRHWRQPSTLADVRAGLDALAEEIVRLELSSLALPALGCGLGGLAWEPVLQATTEALSGLPDTVAIHLFPPRPTRSRRA